MKYSVQKTISTSETDFTGALSLIGAAKIVQDVICDYFATFGFDNLSLRSKFGCVWVFTKNVIKTPLPCGWAKKLTIKTFVTRVSNVSVWVDTSFVREDGETAVYSRTEMCVLDLAKQCVRRISDINFPTENILFEPEQELSFSRFIVEGGEMRSSFNVPPSAIDYSNHTNNVEYIRFCVDATSCKEVVDRKIGGVEIHYLNQTREGYPVTVFAKNEGNTTYFKISSENAVAARCAITFKN